MGLSPTLPDHFTALLHCVPISRMGFGTHDKQMEPTVSMNLTNLGIHQSKTSVRALKQLGNLVRSLGNLVFGLGNFLKQFGNLVGDWEISRNSWEI